MYLVRIYERGGNKKLQLYRPHGAQRGWRDSGVSKKQPNLKKKESECIIIKKIKQNINTRTNSFDTLRSWRCFIRLQFIYA